MVGGDVVEVVQDGDRLWVNCIDRHYRNDYCAIYVLLNDTSRQIEEGDGLWWQGNKAYWTPRSTGFSVSFKKEGVDFDIEVPRIGCSGVSRPGEDDEEED